MLAEPSLPVPRMPFDSPADSSERCGLVAWSGTGLLADAVTSLRTRAPVFGRKKKCRDSRENPAVIVEMFCLKLCRCLFYFVLMAQPKLFEPLN